MTRAAVVAEVAISIADGDGSAVAAAWGVGLELGELLIAVHGDFQGRAGRLQHLHRN